MSSWQYYATSCLHRLGEWGMAGPRLFSAVRGRPQSLSHPSLQSAQPGQRCPISAQCLQYVSLPLFFIPLRRGSLVLPGQLQIRVLIAHFCPRRPTQKAWTQGTNPITQRPSNQQNGIPAPGKGQVQKVNSSKESNTADKHANDRLLFLLGNLTVSGTIQQSFPRGVG